MKKVAVIFNGGTISMKVDEKIKAAVPTLSGEDIMAMVTGIEKFAEIETFSFSSLPSPHMTPNLMFRLSEMVKELLDREEIAGVVVTHGTDTLEETAYYLDLTIDSDKPVVVTGSMRNGSELGYDGPANLASAIVVATSKEAMNKGVLVCMNNEINCASEVTKEHSMHLNTFQSPEFGPIGIVDSNVIIFYRNKLIKQHIKVNNMEVDVKVIKACAGDDGELINYCIDKNVDGIVIEGMGRGNIPPDMAKAVARGIEKGVVFVLVSRCFKGRVMDSYGYDGGGRQLRDMGVIFGDRLPGQKARIKLMVALSNTKEKEEIRKMFEEGLYKNQ